MNESTDKTDYTAAGDQDSMLKSFEDFPDWAKKMLSCVPEVLEAIFAKQSVLSLSLAQYIELNKTRLLVYGN